MKDIVGMIMVMAEEMYVLIGFRVQLNRNLSNSRGGSFVLVESP